MAVTTQDIQKLYVTYFNRPADPGGLTYWTNAANATSLNAVAAEFAKSSEYAAAFVGKSPIEVVDQIYLNLFGRHVESLAAANYWGDKIAQNLITVAQAANAIAAGAQGTDLANLTNKIAVATTFTASVDTVAEAIAYSGALANASAKAFLSTVTDTNVPGATSIDAAVAAAVAAHDVATIDAPKTIALTNSATDVANGGTGNDTIIGQVGQTTTLQSSDVIHGAGGPVDTLRVVTDNSIATALVGGFTVDGVEVLEVQAQSTTLTTLSLENVVGLTTIRSSSSSAALQLDQVKNIVDLEVKGSIGVVAPSLTVNYQAPVVAGATDTQRLLLNGSTMGTLTVNGIETLAVTSNTAASTVAAVAGTTLSKVTVAGDQLVTITGALGTTVKSLDASAQTAGGIVATMGVVDATVVGGAGADKITFTSGNLNNLDSYNGGAGRDTLIATSTDLAASVTINGVATTYAAAAKITNVETIEFSNSLATDFDSTKIVGEDTYTLNGFSAASISGATGTLNLNLNTGTGSTANTGVLTVATPTTLNVVLNNATVLVPTDGLGAYGTISAAAATTIALVNNGVSTATDSTKTNVSTLTLTAAAATKLTVTGAEDLTLTLAGTALATLDASGSSGANNFTGVTYKSTGATVTGGTGADTIIGSAGADVIATGAGADAITGGAGADTLTGGDGIDTFTYTALGDSTGTAIDTITDFVTGVDKLSFASLAASVGRAGVVLKAGSAANFGAAQAAIALNSGVTQIVYQADTNTLWVDLNDDGTLNNNDLQIKLTGVTAVTAADVGGGAVIPASTNYTATAGIDLFNATAAAVGTAPSSAPTLSASFAGVAGTAPTLNQSASISTTVANLSALDTYAFGTATTDTLTFLDTATGLIINTNAVNGANVRGVDVIQLANVPANTITYTAVSNAGETLKGGSGQDIITVAAAAGVTNIQTGAGSDVVTYTATIGTAGNSLDLGAGNDNVTFTAVADMTSLTTLVGGTETDTITFSAAVTTLVDASFTKTSGFEAITLAGADTIVLGSAAFTAGIRNVTLGAGTNSVTSSYGGLGTLTIDSALMADNSVLTLGATASGGVAITGLLGDVTETAGGTANVSIAANTGATTATDFTVVAAGSGTLTLTGGLATKTATVTGVADGAGVVTVSGLASALNITYVDQTSNAITLATGSGNTTVTGNASDTITVTGLATTGQSFTGIGSIFKVTAGAGAHSITTAGLADTITTLATTGATVITSGAGNDTINLGANSAIDKIVFSGGATAAATLTANGSDTITGFALGDTINVAALGNQAEAALTTGAAVTTAAAVSVIADGAVYLINTTAATNGAGGAGSLTTGGTAVITDFTNMTQVAAYLGERFTHTTTTADIEGVFVFVTATTTYIYNFDSLATANTTIDANEVVLVGTITTAATNVVAGSIVFA